jgi:nucleoside-diphosphate-sugar epimerase
MHGERTSVEHRRPSALVTGSAGFIGSHLCEQLLEDGWSVTGVDCFTPFYARERKEGNLRELRSSAHFQELELDLSRDDLDGVLDGTDVVFHLAAQAGVRASFDGFVDYVRHNVLATQRLLEAAAGRRLRRFVYASSSSVYGTATSVPTSETEPRVPESPYGMTKLATEELAALYHRTEGIPTVGLRYFTVYGPRQRPDMAFTRFLEAALAGRPLSILGDGRQQRDFTFVADAVRATLAAGERGTPGGVYNVGGGTPVRLSEVLALLEELLDAPLDVRRTLAARGDVRHTCADPTRAAHDLGFAPATPLAVGIASQLAWIRTGRVAEELSVVR